MTALPTKLSTCENPRDGRTNKRVPPHLAPRQIDKELNILKVVNTARLYTAQGSRETRLRTELAMPPIPPEVITLDGDELPKAGYLTQNPVPDSPKSPEAGHSQPQNWEEVRTITRYEDGPPDTRDTAQSTQPKVSGRMGTIMLEGGDHPITGDESSHKFSSLHAT